MMNNIFAISY